MNDPRNITLSGVPEGYDARAILDEIAKHGRPVAHVARDDKRMAAMQAALRFFAPEMPVITFPSWDCLPYDRVSPNADISAQRMATLAALVHGMPEKFVLLTTLNAASQRIPARETLRDAAFAARVGSRIDEVEGVSYGAFIVPGLIMLSVITQSIAHASFGISFAKFIGPG